MGVKIEGVSFNAELCKEMSKEEFIRRHSEHFAERSQEVRNKILSDTYERICPPPKGKRKADLGNVEVRE